MKKFLLGVLFIFLFTTDTFAISEDAEKSVVQIQTFTGSGSAVFISKVHLLTNHHVIAGAHTINICIPKSSFTDTICVAKAEVITSDEEMDIALLKLSTKDWDSDTFLRLGDSSLLEYGDIITALGYPDNGGDTLTVTSGNFAGYFIGGVDIKANTSISYGNSGGALLNIDSEIIGINKAVSVGGIQNMGVSLSSNVIKTWLFSIGYDDPNLYGSTYEELIKQKEMFADLLKKYQKGAKEQQPIWKEIKNKYDDLRESEEDEYQKTISHISTEEQNFNRDYALYMGYDLSYSEKVEMREMKDDFDKVLEEARQNAEDIRESNLELIDEQELLSMEEEGIIDFQSRINQAQKAIKIIKDKISKVRLASARAKAEISNSEMEIKEEIKTPSTKTEVTSTTQTETTLKKYLLDELKFKKIDDFKVLAKKTPKGIILMLWKPESNIASQIKGYEYSLTDENGEKQTVILHKKKLLLFKPKEGKTYHFQVIGKDKNGDVVAEAAFMMEE